MTHRNYQEARFEVVTEQGETFRVNALKMKAEVSPMMFVLTPVNRNTGENEHEVIIPSTRIYKIIDFKGEEYA